MPNPHQAALQAYEGFNTNRPQNRRTSAKDSFYANSSAAPVAPINDKAALGAWFNQYVRPGFEADGHRVSSVDGDKFTYGNHEGNFTVDYGRGAGAEGGALAWQAEGADDATRARYGNPALTAQRQGDPIGRFGGQQSDLMAQILQALQGQQQPVDPQALLLQQLR